jgi:DNA-binding MarR family transcriptional regulator
MGENGGDERRFSPADDNLVAYARFLLKTAACRANMASDLRLVSAQWNILLDLFISASDRRAVPTGDTCLASTAPHSTALRHVIFLMETGYVTRVSDPDDARRTLVGLTPEGLEFVGGCLSAEFDALGAILGGRSA